jgi:hypothetical protein
MVWSAAAKMDSDNDSAAMDPEPHAGAAPIEGPANGGDAAGDEQAPVLLERTIRKSDGQAIAVRGGLARFLAAYDLSSPLALPCSA